MALDIGSRVVGAAVGNFLRMEQGYMPTPLPPFNMPESVHAFCKSVFSLAKKEGAGTVILGYPIAVHREEKDKKGENFKKKIKAWARRLELYGEKKNEGSEDDCRFCVFLQNEAFTTYAARQRNPLFEKLSKGISRRTTSRALSEKMAKKGASDIKNIDSFSACEILMVYVDKMIRKRSGDFLKEKPAEEKPAEEKPVD